MYPEQAGAGGNWPVIDDIIDPNVIQQEGDLSCGVACGVMLLGDFKINVTQAEIENLTGVPVSCQRLVLALNTLDLDNSRQWEGGPLNIPNASDSEIFDTLNTTGSWAALLWEPGNRIGHFVLVDGQDNSGYVLIRDPWDGTRYKMIKDEFLQYWTLYGVYRKRR